MTFTEARKKKLYVKKFEEEIMAKQIHKMDFFLQMIKPSGYKYLSDLERFSEEDAKQRRDEGFSNMQ